MYKHARTYLPTYLTWEVTQIKWQKSPWNFFWQHVTLRDSVFLNEIQIHYRFAFFSVTHRPTDHTCSSSSSWQTRTSRERLFVTLLHNTAGLFRPSTFKHLRSSICSLKHLRSSFRTIEHLWSPLCSIKYLRSPFSPFQHVRGSWSWIQFKIQFQLSPFWRQQVKIR